MLLSIDFNHQGRLNCVFFSYRNGSKQNSGGSAQLTIFYAGSVNVFDDVSPEKVLIPCYLCLLYL